MKKLLSFILILTFLITCVPAKAAVGDIVGNVLSTDITAYIDYLLVPTYNIDGNTVVLVRDLENYGFTVLWDEYSKRVDFYKDFSRMSTPKIPVIQTIPVGTKLFDVYSTDIQVYFGGKKIEAYNIGGYTAVKLRDINLVGDVVFNEEKRTANVFCADIEYFDDEIAYFQDRFYPALMQLSRADIAHNDMLAMVQSGKYDKKTADKFRENRAVFEETFKSFKEYKEPYGFDKSALELWWSLVNMNYAFETAELMFSAMQNSQSTDELMTAYNAYRTDSYQQRQSALIMLFEDMMNVAYFWN